MFGHEGRALLRAPSPILRIADEADALARTAAIREGIENAQPDVVVAIDIEERTNHEWTL